MQERGFFESLFDMSFTSFITMRLLKVLYVLSVVLIGLGAVAWIVVAFAASVGFGVVVLFILAPLASLLYVIYVRVILELIMAVFRIMETNTELVDLQRTAAAHVSAPPVPPAYGGGGPSFSPPPPRDPPPTEPPAYPA